MRQHQFLDFVYLKSVVSLEQVLRTRDLLGALRPHGDNLVGPCPLHKGDNPGAFVVSRRKNVWYCFTRCRRGGDVVELLRALDGLSYRDTALALANLAGVAAATGSSQTTFVPFTRQLRLEHDTPFLVEKGIRAATARQFEAGLYAADRGFLRGCVAVRLHDLDGQPLGYAGRRLDPDLAAAFGKWKLPAGFPKRTVLFNFHRVRPSMERGLAIVEDPWSVMRLHQVGVPAVALLGTSLSEAQRALLAPARRLLLLLDGDEAGLSAAAALRTRLAPAPVSVAHLPDQTDPDQLTDPELRALCRLALHFDPTEA